MPKKLKSEGFMIVSAMELLQPQLVDDMATRYSGTSIASSRSRSCSPQPPALFSAYDQVSAVNGSRASLSSDARYHRVSITGPDGHDRGGLDYGIPPPAQLLANIRPETEKKEPKWRKYVKIVGLHVGLIVLCFVYSVGGMLVFYHIEQPIEVDSRKQSLSKMDDAGAQLKKRLLELRNTEHKAEWTQQAQVEVDAWMEEVFEAFGNRYVTEPLLKSHTAGNSVSHTLAKTPTKWTYSNALFFAVTTITTIGYGGLVPVTPHGRLICIVYALIGVPLILVTIADVGKFISDIVLYVYDKYRKLKARISDCCGGQEINAKKLSEDQVSKQSKSVDELQDNFFGEEDDDEFNIPVLPIFLLLIGYTAFGAVLFQLTEGDWQFLESFYFSFITMTTVGFGDFIPMNSRYYAVTLIYIIIGLALTTMCVDLVGGQYIRKIHYFGRTIKSTREAIGRTMAELMQYATLMRKKYGLTEEQMMDMSRLANAEEMAAYFKALHAFTPADIERLRYIDGTSSSRNSTTATSLGPRPRLLRFGEDGTILLIRVDGDRNPAFFNNSVTEETLCY